MQTYQVKGLQGLSSIYVGESLKNLKKYLPLSKTIIITDDNILACHGKDFPDLPIITIGTGESIKTLATIESILEQLIDLDCDRTSFIVGIGGGVVCDITGFAASIFMRGVKFGFVSTSLLSQVDASVGGKNGVNLDSYKNMVGVFNQPEFVICDITLLHTLPKNEISNGFGEIVKHALIYDAPMIEFIEDNIQKALQLDYETIFRLVADSVKIKSQVVQMDEKEAGERRKLNFGHTIGHALEKINNPGHGRAVAMGIVAAAKFSQQKKWIKNSDVIRIINLLDNLNLPTELNYLASEVKNAAKKDKKKEGDDLFYIFLERLGKARVDKISIQEMNSFISSVFN